MRLGAQVDLVDVTMIAEKQGFAAVGNENEGIIGKRHRGLLCVTPS
jgi:hypothetical protein